MWILSSLSACVHRPCTFRRAAQIFRGNRRDGTSSASSPEKKQKPEWPEQIVDDANHVMLAEGGRRKNKTSVAPYFRARTISQNFVAGVCSAGRFSRTKTPSNSSNRANSLFVMSFSVKLSPDF